MSKLSIFLGLLFLFVVLRVSPSSAAVDCFTAWSTCVDGAEAEWEIEHEDKKTHKPKKATEGDTMLIHYHCVAETLLKHKECKKEITDGVCNKEDRDFAMSLGDATMKSLEDYCTKWGLKI